MKILHLYSQDEPLIAQHVQTLVAAGNADFVHLTKPDVNKEVLPDIIHVHGCWTYNVARQAMKAHGNGGRVVFSPHGGLDPWIIRERRLTEKLAKSLLWQRRLAESAYVMVAHSTIEADNLNSLNWNPRVETIRDATVTHSITPEAMGRQTHEVYRKVMDSNTIALMDEDTCLAMTILLKAAITGDRRWVASLLDSTPAGKALTSGSLLTESWRKLLIYAEHENFRDMIDQGAKTAHISMPQIDTTHIKSYLPTAYHRPVRRVCSVEVLVREMERKSPTMLQLIQLEEMLRRDNIEEEALVASLTAERQLKFFRRILQLLHEQTLIEEGFLPCQPLNDKQTESLRELLTNHQRI